jgi:hypothetical protein
MKKTSINICYAVDRDSATLNEAENIREIKELLENADQSNVRARYQVALIIEESYYRDDSRHAIGFVVGLAEEISCSRDEVRQYLLVARSWSPEEIEAILERKNSHGMSITWSHLTTLAQIGDKEERDAILSFALEEELTVRELKQLLKEAVIVVEDGDVMGDDAEFDEYDDEEEYGFEEGEDDSFETTATDKSATNAEASESGLDDIDRWCPPRLIQGDESGKTEKPFDIARARTMCDQCREDNVAHFLKQQFETHLVEDGQRKSFEDRHGSDWSEWAEDLRMRDFPHRRKGR